MIFLKFDCVILLLFLGFAESGWSTTIVGGNVIAHWSSKGNMFKTTRNFCHGEVNGSLEESPPLQESTGLFSRDQIRCQVSVNIDPKTKSWDSFGTCTISLQDTHEVIHSRWACKSLAETYEGEFTWMWGTGRCTGISGTTKFQSSMKVGVTGSGAIHGEAA